jgi:hypothetical protein
MNRFTLFVTSALAFGAGCVLPTDTSPRTPAIESVATNDVVTATSPLKQEKPTLTTTACSLVSTNQLVVTVTWAAETIISGQLLEIAIELRGKQHLYAKAGGFVVGPYDPQPAFATFYIDQIKDVSGVGITWDRFTSISATAGGAFADTAPTIRQSTDWPNCTT